MLLIKFLVLILFSVIAAYTDYRQGKIFNWVNFSLLMIGIVIAVYEHRILSSGLGIVLGFVLMFPFFVSGGMGAGDVKFAMATGSVVGGKYLLLILAVAALLVLLYAIFRKMRILEILKEGFSAIGKLIKKVVNSVISILRFGVAGGMVVASSMVEKKSEIEEKEHRIRYGVFLGASNILMSFYLIIEQGGIK